MALISVATQPNFNGRLTKPPLMLWHIQECQPLDDTVDLITYYHPNPIKSCWWRVDQKTKPSNRNSVLFLLHFSLKFYTRQKLRFTVLQAIRLLYRSSCIDRATQWARASAGMISIRMRTHWKCHQTYRFPAMFCPRFVRVNQLFIISVSRMVRVYAYNIIFRTHCMVSYVFRLKWGRIYANGADDPQNDDCVIIYF